MLEYVLWGTPAGQTDALYARPLTCTADPARVEQVRELATRDGWHSFRVQTLDGSRPDFAAAIRP